jgi:hypothetical protein
MLIDSGDEVGEFSVGFDRSKALLSLQQASAEPPLRHFAASIAIDISLMVPHAGKVYAIGFVE